MTGKTRHPRRHGARLVGRRRVRRRSGRLHLRKSAGSAAERPSSSEATSAGRGAASTAEQWRQEDEEKGRVPISAQVTEGQNDGRTAATPQ